jgi:hypothetical protein
MAFRPDIFLSHIKAQDGLAKPSRFRVLIPIPNYLKNYKSFTQMEKELDSLREVINQLLQDLSGIRNPWGNLFADDTATLSRSLALQCESTELPGKSLQTQDVKIYGPTFKIPFQSQYNDITLNFLCTNRNFYERKLFDAWIESIMPTDTNNLRFPRSEFGTYLSNIKIIQYDESVNQIHIVELIDAFPVSISPQPLSWSEDGFHRLSVQFAYERYRTIYEKEDGQASYSPEVISPLGPPSTNPPPPQNGE